jgi:hypothetical protein
MQNLSSLDCTQIVPQMCVIEGQFIEVQATEPYRIFREKSNLKLFSIFFVSLSPDFRIRFYCSGLRLQLLLLIELEGRKKLSESKTMG